MSPETLDAVAARWQKAMRLQDWDVQIEILSAKEMGQHYGRSRILPSKKISIISLLDPESDTDDLVPYDPERTLVHELLHLQFYPADSLPEDSRVVIEQGVHAVATLLTELLEQIKGLAGGPARVSVAEELVTAADETSQVESEIEVDWNFGAGAIEPTPPVKRKRGRPPKGTPRTS